MTTNSITQVFSRRVIEGWLADNPSPLAGMQSPSPLAGEGGAPSGAEGEGSAAIAAADAADPSPNPLPQGERAKKLHLTLAIPDHPWTRATRDAAAVRIAMTVAEAGPGEGKLVEIVREAGLDTDEPELEERDTVGRINADLSVGTDVTQIAPLKANQGLCGRGVQLMGAGFIVTPQQARELGLGRRPGLEAHIREYRNGRDLLQRPRGVMVIDLFGLSEQEVMERFPEVYQHVRKNVYEKTWNPDANKGKGAWEGREVNPRKSYQEFWWIFGEPRRELRPALDGLPNYFITVESAARRIFVSVDAEVLPDNKMLIFATDDSAILGVLMSSIHIEWWTATAGMLGSYDRPAVYVKSQAFDPFPFPERSEKVAEIAERLDAARKAALAESDKLTMTGLYNFVAAIREGTLSPEQEAAATRARAFIVAKLHDDLDQAVADAYGWGEEWRRAPLPPAEVVRRLVALNAARAAEEREGTVRWLRPDYQIPRFGPKKG